MSLVSHIDWFRYLSRYSSEMSHKISIENLASLHLANNSINFFGKPWMIPSIILLKIPPENIQKIYLKTNHVYFQKFYQKIRQVFLQKFLQLFNQEISQGIFKIFLSVLTLEITLKKSFRHSFIDFFKKFDFF